MKKIRLFSVKTTEGIEGEEAELYVNFYLVLNKDYIFTFLIDAPNLACSDRHPIKLWKHFLILLEEENVKYMRRYEKMQKQQPKTGYWIYRGQDIYECSECGENHHGNYGTPCCENCGTRMR